MEKNENSLLVSGHWLQDLAEMQFDTTAEKLFSRILLDSARKLHLHVEMNFLQKAWEMLRIIAGDLEILNFGFVFCSILHTLGDVHEELDQSHRHG